MGIVDFLMFVDLIDLIWDLSVKTERPDPIKFLFNVFDFIILTLDL